MSEYDSALDAQVEWTSFWQSDKGIALMRGLAEHSTHAREVAGELQPYKLADYADDERTIVVSALVNGECFYWSRQMLDVVSIASESLPSTWALAKEYVPAISGFFYFERELSLPEVPGLWGLGWTVVTQDPGTKVAAIHLPNREGRMPDFNSLALVTFIKNKTFRIPIPARMRVDVGETLDAWNKDIRNYYVNELNADPSDVDHEFSILRLFAAMLSFLQQRIMVSYRYYAERHTRKRIQSIRESEPVINVVKLRAIVHHTHEGEGEPVDWSCRWIVRGHWRDQWYPSIRRNQPIWITPYIKGPEDKPLRNPERLFAVVR